MISLNRLKNLELKKNRFIFLLVLLSGILLYGLLNEYYTVIYLCMIVSLAIISYAVPFILFFFMKVEISSNTNEVIPNEQNNIQVNFISKLELLTPHKEIEYFLNQPFSKQREHERITLKQNTFPITLRHCGKVDFSINRVYTYDLLYLLPIRKRVKYQYSYYVYPKLTSVTMQMETIHSNKRNEKGDDLTEIYELRDYQEGDPMKAIHWKRSSKDRKLISKVGTDNSEASTTLFLKLTKNTNENDQILSMFHSLALELVKETIFNVAYYYQEELVIRRISSRDEYIQVLEEVLSMSLNNFNDYDYNQTGVYTIAKGGIEYGNN